MAVSDLEEVADTNGKSMRRFDIITLAMPIITYVFMRLDSCSLIGRAEGYVFIIGFAILALLVYCFFRRFRKGFSSVKIFELEAELEEYKFITTGVSLGSIIQIKGLTIIEIAFAFSCILLLCVYRRKVFVNFKEMKRAQEFERKKS